MGKKGGGQPTSPESPNDIEDKSTGRQTASIYWCFHYGSVDLSQLSTHTQLGQASLGRSSLMQYSVPSSFVRHFRKEHPDLYNHPQEAHNDKVSWKDVIHWMWPLFTEDWGLWKSLDLKLSAVPFMVCPLLLPTNVQECARIVAVIVVALSNILLLDPYRFSKEVVENPGTFIVQSSLSSSIGDEDIERSVVVGDMSGFSTGTFIEKEASSSSIGVGDVERSLVVVGYTSNIAPRPISFGGMYLFCA
ncbi:hypothetical protein BC332_33178 [Capsicum chinense]|nr:hypothetical protein BC332_33178 [Capsicum chinense]